MSELVDKYFREDLTEAEQQALADLLASSDEAALAFDVNSPFVGTQPLQAVRYLCVTHGNLY